MYVTDVKLKNFRNYENGNINFGKGVNIIYGNNAQGKTNILESIYAFTTGKSYRTNKDSEMILFDKEFANIKISFLNSNGINHGEIVLSSDKKKRIKINEVPINKIGELMGFFNAVIFSPEDLNLIKEGPSQRRKFINICISQLRPNYFYYLQQYIKVLNQRNNLLKSLSFNKSLIDTLPIWDEKLIECGSRIILSRLIFIEKIRTIAKEIHINITRNKEDLKIEYRTNVGIQNYSKDNIEEIKEIFKKKLERNRKRELNYGMTLIGPHRDDINFFINDMQVKKYGSQGQQRTVVLTLKMAEMELINEELGEYPILLLDDIMSELDKSRQDYIMNNIMDKQVIITCTDINGFNIDKKNYIYRIENGKIYNEAKRCPPPQQVVSND